MNLLTDDEKLLYDSCEDFAKLYVFLKVRKHNAKQIVYCEGDKSIPKLCSRCPFYNRNHYCLDLKHFQQHHTEFIDLNQ